MASIVSKHNINSHWIYIIHNLLDIPAFMIKLQFAKLIGISNFVIQITIITRTKNPQENRRFLKKILLFPKP